MLGLVWAMRFMLVEDIYTLNKVKELQSNADLVEANIDHSNLDELVNRISFNNSTSVRVINTNGTVLYKADANYCTLQSLSESSLTSKYTLALESENGEYISHNQFKDLLLNSNEDLHFDGDQEKINQDNAINILYARIITTSAGEKLCVIMDSTITPMLSNDQSGIALLVIASICIVIFVVIIAFILGQLIAEPIKLVTSTATEIKNGNYNVDFKGEGYQEIDDLNDALRKASQELASVDKYRQELVANVSHDLRTPLSLIKGYCELMSDIPTERTPENFTIISDEVDRLSALVNDMLDLNRTQEELSKLQLGTFNIVASVAEIAKRLKTMLSARGLNVQFNTDDAKLMVYADEMKISQVIYNLLSNAINYVGEDKLVLLNITKVNGNVRIEVTDHGDGIDVAILPNIWDRYYKSDRNHIRAHIGTGLGLSIVKTVMASHSGGQYGVITEKGKGSTFYIELPLLY